MNLSRISYYLKILEVWGKSTSPVLPGTFPGMLENGKYPQKLCSKTDYLEEIVENARAGPCLCRKKQTGAERQPRAFGQEPRTA